jgi:hypothetical protein
MKKYLTEPKLRGKSESCHSWSEISGAENYVCEWDIHIYNMAVCVREKIYKIGDRKDKYGWVVSSQELRQRSTFACEEERKKPEKKRTKKKSQRNTETINSLTKRERAAAGWGGESRRGRDAYVRVVGVSVHSRIPKDPRKGSRRQGKKRDGICSKVKREKRDTCPFRAEVGQWESLKMKRIELAKRVEIFPDFWIIETEHDYIYIFIYIYIFRVTRGCNKQNLSLLANVWANRAMLRAADTWRQAITMLVSEPTSAPRRGSLQLLNGS